MTSPRKEDLLDAIEHADIYGDQGWSLNDFDIKYLGKVPTQNLHQYDSLDWLDFLPSEFEGMTTEQRFEELEGFRGSEWAERAKQWLITGIPPIIVISAPVVSENELYTQIGDGRGRVNFAHALDINKIPVYHMIYKGKTVNATLKIIRSARFKRSLEKYANTPSVEKLKSILSELANKVQQEYDQWNQEADEELGDFELGFGGICQNFAEIIADSINTLTDFDATTVSAQIGEQHVYTIVKTPDGIYEVDIPYCVYETGGGYNWQKIHGVTFGPDSFVINMIDSDSENWNDYLEWDG